MGKAAGLSEMKHALSRPHVHDANPCQVGYAGADAAATHVQPLGHSPLRRQPITDPEGTLAHAVPDVLDNFRRAAALPVLARFPQMADHGPNSLRYDCGPSGTPRTHSVFTSEQL